jgi:hypothetical protein
MKTRSQTKIKTNTSEPSYHTRSISKQKEKKENEELYEAAKILLSLREAKNLSKKT